MKNQLFYLLVFCIPFLGFSQSETTQEIQKSSWKYNITPNLWMTGMSGDISIMDQTTSLDVAFSDVLENLKMAAMIHAEAENGKWAIMLDYVYAKLESSGDIQGLQNTRTITATIKQSIVSFGVAYNFVSVNTFSLDALIGVRYFDLSVDLDFENIDTINKGIDFTYPYVGMRFTNYWNRFGIGGRFDVGGFGIGSDKSYKYNIFTEYKFTELFQLQFGYQGYVPDYDENGLKYNVASEGFILGLNFSL